MKKALLLLFALLFACPLSAQVKGRVVDASAHSGIPFAVVICETNNQTAICDSAGFFNIRTSKGNKITASCIGYEKQTVLVEHEGQNITFALTASTQSINSVIVRGKRKKYTRKNNPAVELMRRVIAAKKQTNLNNHDYYQYEKYQKMTFAISDIDTTKQNRPKWYSDHLEHSYYNGKTIQSISVDETITRHLYRKTPNKERNIIIAQQTDGVNKMIQTGEILNTMLKEVFQDVNIYDDYIRLVQYPFPSPIGSTAISFYHFQIEDTISVSGDSCYHLYFYPTNTQDFGFSGDLYVLKDSTLHVKACTLNIPKKSDVNFVKSMRIEQEFSQLDNGEWVLTRDDMWSELSLAKIFSSFLVTRNTRLSDYQFSVIAPKLLRGKAPTKEDPDSRIRNKDFWNEQRPIALTHGESTMDDFLHGMEHSKRFAWIQALSQVFLENFMATSKYGQPSKFDLGPLNTIVSHNYVDGYRLRMSGRTMAALNPHLFWKGFGAYGMDSHRWYYGTEITYALNKKQLSPFEFPMRNIVFESNKDVMAASDKYLYNNKNNVFSSFRTQTVKDMYFYNRQKLSFIYETDWGLNFNTGIKAESNETTGTLHFLPLDGSPEIKKIRTTELSASIGYCPDQTYINTKQRRLPVNLDAPDLQLSHTMAVNDFLGGQYKMNMTQLKLYKRQWLGSWGYINMNVNAGAEWNKVPFPLLIMPPVTLTYFMEKDNETFCLMRNMEFLNDRFIFWNFSWDMNGKILNRIPLIRKLKWREYLSIKGMWGHLTHKNNPTSHPSDPTLFQFPECSHIMTNKPYWEMTVGVHNIFKFLAVNYVRRLTYQDNQNVDKWGLRFAFIMSF